MAAGMLNTSDDRRELWTGFGDGLARAFELAVTPAIFGVLGFLLDTQLGIVPVFTLLFSIWALTWMFIKTWREYDAQMKREESRRARGIGTQHAAPASSTSTSTSSSTFGHAQVPDAHLDVPKNQATTEGTTR